MMKTIIASTLTVLLACSFAAAAPVYLVDVGSSSGSAGAGWNTISLFSATIPANAQGDVTLTSTDGLSTIGLANIVVSAGERGFSSGTGTIYPPADSWVVPAAGDYEWMYDQDDNDVVALHFALTGLDNGKTYTIDLFAARYNTGTDLIDVTVDGAFSDSSLSDDFDFGRNSLNATVGGQVLTWTEVAPSAGSLSVSMTGVNRLAVNAIRITEVPEPATLGLIALGGLVALRRRR